MVRLLGVLSGTLLLMAAVACSAPFDSATVVTLSESSSSPSAFLGWSRDCTGEGACQVVMAGPSAVSARFETGDRTVTVEIVSGFGTGVVSAGGGISCIVDDGEVSGACAATLPVGTQMVMTAVATEANTAFDGWSGDVCTNDTGNCEFTLGEDVTVVAALPRKATVGIVGTPDVSFTANEGSNPPDQIKQFSNAGREGDRDLNFTTHSSESWLTVSPAEGSLFPGEIGNLVLRVQSASLAPGNYSAEVEIRDPEGSMSGGGSVPRVIDVTLRVN